MKYSNKKHNSIRRKSFARKCRAFIALVVVTMAMTCVLTSCTHHNETETRTAHAVVYDNVEHDNGAVCTQMLCTDGNIFEVVGTFDEIGTPVTLTLDTQDTDDITDDAVVDFCFDELDYEDYLDLIDSE